MCGKQAFGGTTHPYCKTKYSVDGLVSFFHYFGPIKKAIKAGKYRYVSHIISFCVAESWKYPHLQAAFEDLQSYRIVAIPLHPKRLRERGYNQAELFANSLAVCTGLSVHANTLQRIKHLPPQVDMNTRVERLTNMQDAFCVTSKTVPQQVLLVDDVFTTGATMRDACRALKSAGVKRVIGCSIAR
jgi:ComF family protein